MEFKRKVYDKMLKWKNEYAPNYVLFLKGARRVGKSTLALKLGKEEYKSFIEIRFDKAPNEIKELFEDITVGVAGCCSIRSDGLAVPHCFGKCQNLSGT